MGSVVACHTLQTKQQQFDYVWTSGIIFVSAIRGSIATAVVLYITNNFLFSDEKDDNKTIKYMLIANSMQLNINLLQFYDFCHTHLCAGLSLIIITTEFTTLAQSLFKGNFFQYQLPVYLSNINFHSIIIIIYLEKVHFFPARIG